MYFSARIGWFYYMRPFGGELETSLGIIELWPPLSSRRPTEMQVSNGIQPRKINSHNFLVFSSFFLELILLLCSLGGYKDKLQTLLCSVC